MNSSHNYYNYYYENRKNHGHGLGVVGVNRSSVASEKVERNFFNHSPPELTGAGYNIDRGRHRLLG
jgi:hypothetical protein